jgi:hypothetical protein
VPRKELEPHPLIFAGEISGNRPLLQAALPAQGVSLRSFYEVQRSSTAVALVNAGVAAEAGQPEWASDAPCSISPEIAA